MTENKKAENETKVIMTIGRRKEATARVYLRSGSGKITVNKRTFEGYFPREAHRLIINQPIKAVNLENKLDIRANIKGGGSSGQAGALRHGIARAIIKLDEITKPVIKSEGFLTRDPRAKERKKYGRKRARKRFQFSKR
ncbi:MAG: 30S ribosomal protein S9 [Candidatus Omnitrophota bacterium]